MYGVWNSSAARCLCYTVNDNEVAMLNANKQVFQHLPSTYASFDLPAALDKG